MNEKGRASGVTTARQRREKTEASSRRGGSVDLTRVDSTLGLVTARHCGLDTSLCVELSDFGHFAPTRSARKR